MLRTHLAGDLRADLAGSTVTLTGWVGRRRDHGGVIFIDMRDRSGYAQVVFRNSEVAERAHHLRSEYCIQVTGVVEKRPEGSENPNLASGEIEVNVTELTILNESAALPFQLEDVGTSGTVGEEARLKYRYLDLRREGPAKIMRLRAAVNRAARKVLDSHDFTEIETPTLTRSTPEGARDFVVPARLKPGTFYALPQSPQLFKQLLMVAGMERYYQIARCYRDEDFRADRQPEFTQLDVEMSFAEQDDVIALAEEILVAIFAEAGVTVQTPIPRMTFKEAMEKYGSDKPDLRFDIPLVECTEFFKDTTFRVFQNDYVGAVVMDGGASQPRRQLDAWQDWARQRGAKGLAYILVGEDGTLGGPVAKNITDAEREGIAAHVGAKPGDCIFFAAGDAKSSRALLGAARGEIAKKLGLIKEGDWAFTWVVDAPLFEPTLPLPVTLPWATRSGLLCTTPSPRRSQSTWIPSTRILATHWLTPTTSSATVTKLVAAPFVFTAQMSRSASSMLWASARKRHRSSSASCWMPSSTALRRTVVSHSVGTVSFPCWPALTPFAKLSPSRSPVAALIR